jgi:hypothetical protein
MFNLHPTHLQSHLLPQRLVLRPRASLSGSTMLKLPETQSLRLFQSLASMSSTEESMPEISLPSKNFSLFPPVPKHSRK